MDSLLNYLWIAAQLVIGFNLIFPFILFCLYLLKFKKTSEPTLTCTDLDYAVIITAYQYVNSLPDAVASALKLNYTNYMVYVVADNCDVSSLKFDDDRVVLLRPETILQGNVKSHFYAIDRFVRNHDVITIIDSDNLVDREYLNELNKFFNKGFKAVQGVREAKNLDTVYSCLDAARDIYYHFYDGKLLFGAGSSATLSGSGMAFTTQLYKECLENRNISGAGFDKVLQFLILAKNLRIAFAPGAIVFDEKTSLPQQLVNQRSRWINTWFKYFVLGFKIIGMGIRNFSLNQLLFGLVLLRPPLFLFLLISGIMLLVNLAINMLAAGLWVVSLALFVFSFIISLRVSNADARIFVSLKGVPRFIFYQLISLTKIFSANKRSVATRHYHTNSDFNRK
ncbi:MAG TPA: glycosyltransferase [Pedobacter sp.]|jgi:cellulose synthase/poly-beta-1,6-N-acetylglucosamine synthase-like glycosyltransferase